MAESHRFDEVEASSKSRHVDVQNSTGKVTVIALDFGLEAIALVPDWLGYSS